jgi:SAM-dependent methyltransferase
MSAAEQWRAELAAWEIPPEILAQAPEPPWGFPVELFRADPEPTDTPSRDRALEALPAGGSVLDVGCGGGAAAFALVPPAGLVIGVDSGPGMTEEFAATATDRGVAHEEFIGTWPDVAPDVPAVDVVVCHHVFYNVGDLVPFATALTAHARRRVVVELTAHHPLVEARPLWQHFHGIDRPNGPSADLAIEALHEMGVEPGIERWARPPRDVPREVYVRLNRRRVCLPASADEEIDRIMGPRDWPRQTVTLWWDV